MNHIPYQSRKVYHKEPFGAVESGTELVFRIVVPRSWGCRAARLLIADGDDKGTRIYPMTWECMEGDGEEWWRVSLRLEKTGLYWYSFVCELSQGPQKIGAGERGAGVWGGEGSFSLTVYNNAYCAPDWLYGGVLYQIFPDRFYNSENARLKDINHEKRSVGNVPLSKLDAPSPLGAAKKTDIPPGRLLRDDWGGEPLGEPIYDSSLVVYENTEVYDFFGGDLAGIIEKLPYLQALGVSCIYLNPIFEANSSHRYDTADYSKIDPLLGTENDFKELCFKAKERGIAIILDGVFSHTGADSLYFNRSGRYGGGGAYRDSQSPYRAWYKFDEYPNKYSAWWGVDILPELREEEPAYLDFIAGEDGIARKWLRMGASGWRLDVADELPDCFLDAFALAIKKEKPDCYLLGEVWEDASDKISYGVRRRYLQGEQLDSVMNYPLSGAILNFVRGGRAQELADTIEALQENYPPRALHLAMNHIGTHDTIRALTLLGGAEIDGRRAAILTPKQRCIAAMRLKIAAVLQYTLPGVPCVYYGDEVGMEGGRDPYNRGCFPWGNEDEGLREHYQMLGKLRREHSLFKKSLCQIIRADDEILIFERYGSEELLQVSVNMKEISFEITFSDI